MRTVRYRHVDLFTEAVYGGALRDKIGGVIVVGTNRNAGQETAIQVIHNFFLVHHMIVVGSGITGSGYGSFYDRSGMLYPQREVSRKVVEEDEIGLKSSRGLGNRVIEVVKTFKTSGIR